MLSVLSLLRVPEEARGDHSVSCGLQSCLKWMMVRNSGSLQEQALITSELSLQPLTKALKGKRIPGGMVAPR